MLGVDTKSSDRDAEEHEFTSMFMYGTCMVREMGRYGVSEIYNVCSL
jgi:hypothetical protein